MKTRKVLVVGSAEKSAGGVASVIKLIKKMPIWEKYHCYWLGTQIQKNYLWKLLYALKANIIGLFIIWRYDIVHFHTVPVRNCLIIQMPLFLFALIGRKRVIMHIHMGNQLRNYTHSSLFLWYLKRTDLIVLLAKRWQTIFNELYSEIKTPTTVLYNPCEDIPDIPFKEKEKVIIMAAYFNENKAPDLLLKAWESICNKFPDWYIYMLGNGEVQRYKEMAKKMGISDSIKFTGYVVGEERESYFRKASILCMCSYEEGFPMVVLEAWAYGICVVTTPVGGLPDILEDGNNAFVFDFGNWQQLANKLESLMSEHEKRREMAIYSRKIVYENFSKEKINDMIDHIYCSI